MEYLGKYSERFRKDLSPEQKHEIAMLKMICIKVKNKYNLKNNKDLSQFLGISEHMLRQRLNGRKKIDSKFIALLCFHLGIQKETIFDEMDIRILDEYTNSKGQLIVDGVNYGRIY